MNAFATSVSLFLISTSSTMSWMSSTAGITFGVKCFSSSLATCAPNFLERGPSLRLTEVIALLMAISIFCCWNGSMLPSRFLTLLMRTILIPKPLFLDLFSLSHDYKNFLTKSY